MAPYWSAGAPAAAAAGPARRASSAGALASAAMQGAVGRKASSAGEAYHRIISSTRNPLYGMTAVGHVGLADSVAGSASDDTSGGSSSASASRHYVDPWDLENFMYLKRHWAAEDGEGEASSTPALESGAQSDFYYVGPSRPAARSSPGLDVDLDVDAYPSMYRPDSVLLEPLALGPASMSVLNAVEEESFFNERFDPSLHQRQHSQHSHRHVRRSHSAAATYLHDALPTGRAGGATPGAPSAYAGRRRSVACAPRYYRTPITGGDSSGEYEAFEDYADELSRRLGAVELERAAAAPQPQSSAASAGPRSKRHSVAVSRPATSHQAIITNA
ncbi:uncharacterized protein LOC127748858 [Frankliniella occidentalis]|uniref:Uncharacterized protein LOC127748858 n=1 Tax=Frankliniella occidentalis TaxID=133901 RepID=A0A9C6WLA4_FRAOC|nr:uncharacterized protein LOC127748858 [Frankliniella occidentalis]